MLYAILIGESEVSVMSLSVSSVFLDANGDVLYSDTAYTKPCIEFFLKVKDRLDKIRSVSYLIKADSLGQLADLELNNTGNIDAYYVMRLVRLPGRKFKDTVYLITTQPLESYAILKRKKSHHDLNNALTSLTIGAQFLKKELDSLVEASNKADMSIQMKSIMIESTKGVYQKAQQLSQCLGEFSPRFNVELSNRLFESTLLVAEEMSLAKQLYNKESGPLLPLCVVGEESGLMSELAVGLLEHLETSFLPKEGATYMFLETPVPELVLVLAAQEVMGHDMHVEKNIKKHV